MTDSTTTKALRRREPLFHRRDLVSSAADADREMAVGYWEIGASGRRYSREFVLATLTERFTQGADAYDAEDWVVTDFVVREIAERTYLVTYVLNEQPRLTARVTLWQGSEADGWKVLYHQGTVIRPA
ncbi:DUF4440 domain-containing protein [Kribbella italica]|uniref:DUF4440 domain-containing protein n=1 Tax=Kribbella italica TaxID=1540520 RepID=A0A7W9J7K7_9ACTN|nr:DUF4440 domain-containing protein [Kribbella italica]MBB5836814.1 hypothetical protein [Kribbella italica]